MTPISSSRQGVSDEALQAATGKIWNEWFTVLDAAGAAGTPAEAGHAAGTAWTHPQIARWLHDTHDVPGWWCQGITVGYEQARGMRLPGQRADGTFEVSASKTLALGQQDALDAVIRAVTEGLGQAPASESRTVTYLTARWALGGRESLLATANPTKAGRTSVSLIHQRLGESAAVAPAKAALKGWLAATS